MYLGKKLVDDSVAKVYDSKLFKKDVFLNIDKEELFKGNRSVKLKSGVFQPLPVMDENQTNCIYVAAPSGSGKSTYITKWAGEYKELFPNNPIYIFSRKNEDAALDNLLEYGDVNRISLDESFLDFKLDNDALDEFSDSLLIFDDIDTLSDKKILLKIKKLRDDIIQTGRSYRISVISSSHTICNYKDTKQVLNECNQITLFPYCGGKAQIIDYLKRYQGMTKEQIQRIIKVPSRWVTLNTRFPIYVITENEAFFID